MYHQLQINSTKNKTLDWILEQIDYNNSYIHVFLKLLKKPGGYLPGSNTIVETSKDK